FLPATATTHIYTLSLHDALPISATGLGCQEVSLNFMWRAPKVRLVCSRSSENHTRSRGEKIPKVSARRLPWPPRCTSTKDFLILDRKSTRLNSSHDQISYAVFCL